MGGAARKRAYHPAGVKAGEYREEYVLVSLTAFIVGTTLALLVGLMCGLTWGVRIGYHQQQEVPAVTRVMAGAVK